MRTIVYECPSSRSLASPSDLRPGDGINDRFANPSVRSFTRFRTHHRLTPRALRSNLRGCPAGAGADGRFMPTHSKWESLPTEAINPVSLAVSTLR